MPAHGKQETLMRARMDREAGTQFAEREGTKIAYRIYGSASRDLIIVPGIISHVEYAHELPGYNEFLDRLSSHHRIIVFDKGKRFIAEN